MRLVIYGQPGSVPLLQAAARAAQHGGHFARPGRRASELFWLWPVLLPPWLSPGNNSLCRDPSGAALPRQSHPSHLHCPPCLSFPITSRVSASPASQDCPSHPARCEGGLCVTEQLSPVCSRRDRDGQSSGAGGCPAEMGFPLLSCSSWPLITSARYLPAISLPAALCPGSNHRVNE